MIHALSELQDCISLPDFICKAGLFLAPFTFGISVPICACLGGIVGAAVDAATGSKICTCRAVDLGVLSNMVTWALHCLLPVLK